MAQRKETPDPPASRPSPVATDGKLMDADALRRLRRRMAANQSRSFAA